MSRAVCVRCALFAAALLAGCGQDRLIGRSCEGPECEALHTLPAPEPQACQHFELEGVVVEPHQRLERCALYTLDGLKSPAGTGRAYISKVTVDGAPFLHDSDLRLAAELPDKKEFGDGTDANCADINSIAVPWLPLMTTFGETNKTPGPSNPDPRRAEWSFDGAPLVVGTSYRLYVNDSFENQSMQAVAAGMSINVFCEDQKPQTVSQTFEMTIGTSLTVFPGSAELHANCSFQQDVIVSRLYRRTRLISGFHVNRFERDQIITPALWPNDGSWVFDLVPPLMFHGGEDLYWSCTYQNSGDTAFKIDGNSADACSLFGLYRLPDGSEDPVPDHCRR